MDRGSIVQGIFEALTPWDINVDDVEPLMTGKPSEQGVTFKLPLRRAAFFFGSAFCKFTQDAAAWESVAETLTIIETAVSTLQKFTTMAMGGEKTAIGVHIQPNARPFMDLLSPFIPPQLSALEKHPPKTMATVAKWAHRKVTIDGSGALANGVFLKFERDFESSITFAEIASQLKRDQDELMNILGVEEDSR